MRKDMQQVIRAVWEDQVRGMPIYHGTSSVNLTDPLDPAIDPFAEIRPALYLLLDVLEDLVEAGLSFTVVEEHFGERWEHDLGNIVAWTRNDLDHPSIDFTTSYYDACTYADCCQGSQLKQNFGYITTHLPGCEGDPVVRARMGAAQWSLVDEVGGWIRRGAGGHTSVVLHVDRACPAFDPDPQCLPAGSLEGFSAKVQAALAEAHLECTPSTLAQILPSEEDGFVVRMQRPLTKEHILRVEKVAPDGLAQAPGPGGVG